MFPDRHLEKHRAASIAADACAGIARAAQWMVLHRFGYHRQSFFGQQLYPGRLSAVPATLSMGVAEHALLAQVHQVKLP
jgi:hypothetical protein